MRVLKQTDIIDEFLTSLYRGLVSNQVLLTPKRFNKWCIKRGYGRLIMGFNSIDTVYNVLLQRAEKYFEVEPAPTFHKLGYWLRKKKEVQSTFGGGVLPTG